MAVLTGRSLGKKTHTHTHNDGLGNNTMEKKVLMKGVSTASTEGGSLLEKSAGAWALREAEMDKVEEEWMGERAKQGKGRDRWSGGDSGLAGGRHIAREEGGEGRRESGE